MKLKPLAGYVLIEPLDEEQTTSSGLVMPDKEKEKPSKGKVVAIGTMPYEMREFVDDPEKYYPEVQVGSIVQYHRWSGQDVKEGQKEYRLVQFKDLMGVYEK